MVVVVGHQVVGGCAINMRKGPKAAAGAQGQLSPEYPGTIHHLQALACSLPGSLVPTLEQTHLLVLQE